jgi:hypothetical protein
MDVITGIVASELDAMGQTSADGGVLLGRVVSQFAFFLGDLNHEQSSLSRIILDSPLQYSFFDFFFYISDDF